MPRFDPQPIQDMRNALEEVMTKVPLEYSTSATKAYLAECILRLLLKDTRVITNSSLQLLIR